MPQRKKPEGKEWEIFCDAWTTSTGNAGENHQRKLSLCRQYGISYDLGKHWISEGDTTRQVSIPTPVEAMKAIEDIMGTQPKLALDAVSFDLETTGFEADFSIILTACIKPFGKDTVLFRNDIYPTWEKERSNDSQIVADIAGELQKHMVVLTHYGHFDIRYLRAKMIRYGLPPLPPMFGIDSYLLAKANMAVSRRRLEALCTYLELGEKSGVEGNLWMSAGLTGSKEAMDAISAHNKQDVILLERLACLLVPYMKNMRRI